MLQNLVYVTLEKSHQVIKMTMIRGIKEIITIVIVIMSLRGICSVARKALSGELVYRRTMGNPECGCNRYTHIILLDLDSV